MSMWLLSSFTTSLHKPATNRFDHTLRRCLQESKMEIEALYVYPIKSMRGVSVPTATLTQNGFPYVCRCDPPKLHMHSLAVEVKI